MEILLANWVLVFDVKVNQALVCLFKLAAIALRCCVRRFSRIFLLRVRVTILGGLLNITRSVSVGSLGGEKALG